MKRNTLLGTSLLAALLMATPAAADSPEANNNDRSEASRTRLDDSRAERPRGEQRNEGRDAASERDRHNNRADRQQQGRVTTRGLQFSDDEKRISVDSVDRNSQWAEWGLEAGDNIISVAKQPVRSEAEFKRRLESVRYNERVPVEVMRDGKHHTIWTWTGQAYGINRGVARFDRNDRRYEDRSDQRYTRTNERTARQAWLGVRLNDRYERHAVVDAVQEGSPADKAGVRPGDWLRAINGRQIRSADHFHQVVDSLTPGATVELKVSRHEMRSLSADLGERPNAFTRFSEENVRRDRRPEREVRERTDIRRDDRRIYNDRFRTYEARETDRTDSDYDTGAYSRERFERDRQ